jgi:hypothetical protein
MTDETRCECRRGQPIWTAYMHEPGTWVHKREEIQAWMRSHGLDPEEIANVVVMPGVDGPEVHAKQYLHCRDHRGRYVDWVDEKPATHTVVVPMHTEPPEVRTDWVSRFRYQG